MMTSGQMIQQLVRFFGVVLVVVGVLGFVPGITTNYNALAVTGPESGAELFGLFRFSVLQNLFHIALGLTGVVLAASWEGARTFALAAAVTLAAVCVYGIVVDERSDANFLATDAAGNVLHGLLAFVLLQTWVVNKDDRDKVGLDSPETVG